MKGLIMSVELTKEFQKLPKTKRDVIEQAAIEYEMLNQQEKLLGVRRNKVFRPIIESACDLYGIEDANEHLHLVMDEAEVIRTKKVSRTLNSVAAEELLKEKGLYDSCVMQVISWEIDEEKIIEAYQAGMITAGELDDIFSEKVTWATSVKSNIESIQQLVDLRKEIEKTEKGELPTIESS
jgi:hypothetical protein